jgi:type III secretion protein L
MSRLFTLIYQGQVHTASNKKVIPLEDYATLMEASEILEKSREDIESYKKKTEEEALQLKKKAEEEGFDTGLEKFNTLIMGLDQEIKRLRHEMNKLVLPLALKAAKKIVGRELETHPETIVDIVIQALAPATQNHRVTIWVNKADKEILEAEKTKLKQLLEHVEVLFIRERDDISPGGCIIETESGIINAAIENQWRALESAFERYIKQT